MKKLIAHKITRLLKLMSGNNEMAPQTIKSIIHESLKRPAETLGAFCKQIPVQLVKFIRPSRTLDF